MSLYWWSDRGRSGGPAGSPWQRGLQLLGLPVARRKKSPHRHSLPKANNRYRPKTYVALPHAGVAGALPNARGACQYTMLINHRHRFLFVHLAKTGGTSIRAALRPLGWRDPLSLAAYVCHRASHLAGHRIGAKIPRHAALIAACEQLPPAYFDTLWKFAFVRNPWDRQVSAYHHFQREQRGLLARHRLQDFADFCDWLLHDAAAYRGPKHVLVAAVRRPQVEHLVDLNRTMLVDWIGRYERLHEDFQHVCRRLSLPSIRLPHRRRSANRADYRQYYNDAVAEQVGRFFRDDVEQFGYRFDDRADAHDLRDAQRKYRSHAAAAIFRRDCPLPATGVLTAGARSPA